MEPDLLLDQNRTRYGDTDVCNEPLRSLEELYLSHEDSPNNSTHVHELDLQSRFEMQDDFLEMRIDYPVFF